jgi:hypothetical protein
LSRFNIQKLFDNHSIAREIGVKNGSKVPQIPEVHVGHAGDRIDTVAHTHFN